MDLDSLFPLLLLALYFLFRLVGRQKPPQRPHPLPPVDDLPDERRDLDEALREIRIALGMEAPPPPPEPPVRIDQPTPFEQPVRFEQPAPFEQPVRMPAPPHPTPAQTPPPVRSRSDTPTPGSSRQPAVPSRLHVQKEAETSEPKRSRRADLMRRLRTPGSVREAILLSEILGPPRSRR